MSFVISIPGKTFLAGEYLAMEGGPALLAMTGPRFELTVSAGSGRLTGVPVGSPAHNLYTRHRDAFVDLDLEFNDPYQGAGGWGASTAQYLAILTYNLMRVNPGHDIDWDTRKLLESYLQDAWNGEGRAPSGADLVGQLRGGFTLFERETGSLLNLQWPFAELDGALIRTGHKVATHDHLRGLTNLDTSAMAPLMETLRTAWKDGDAESFTESINNYRRTLEGQKLVTENTLSLLHGLLWLDGVKAAKGCGALGADVVFVVFEKTAKQSLARWCEENELVPTYLSDGLSAGLEIRGLPGKAMPEINHV